MSSTSCKRTSNVRSSSSCSSTGSNEPSLETGYISDNSTTDSELVTVIHDNTRNVGFPTSNRSSHASLNHCSVLKKEFVLAIDNKKIRKEIEGTNNYMSRRRSKCLSKNAVMARMNRIRKKQYLEGLEKELENIAKENVQLKDQVKKNDEIVIKLKEEVKYLKSVLANSREISMLLKSVRHNTGLSATSSLDTYSDVQNLNSNNCKIDSPFMYGELYGEDSLTFNSSELNLDSLFTQSLLDIQDDPFLSCGNLESMDVLDHKPTANLIGTNENHSSDVGVCLHIAKQHVSLEFCPSCSSNAISSRKNGL